MLGDSPDVMDVSMTFTPAIVYQQSRNTFTVDSFTGVEAGSQDFKFVLRQAFLEMKNVFKGAPEITFEVVTGSMTGIIRITMIFSGWIRPGMVPVSTTGTLVSEKSLLPG